MIKTITADTGKVFAYQENGTEIILGEKLYLGVNDDGTRYYQIDKPVETPKEADNAVD